MGLSSCFILLGSALLYVNTGITFIEGIYALYSSTEVMLIQSQDWLLSLFENQVKEKWIKTNEVNPIESFDISLIILSIGYLFKVSSAPFHFWSPVQWFRKSQIWEILSNSWDILKFLIPNFSLNMVSGWINHSCMVTSKKMNNRGSKSVNILMLL